MQVRFLRYGGNYKKHSSLIESCVVNILSFFVVIIAVIKWIFFTIHYYLIIYSRPFPFPDIVLLRKLLLVMNYVWKRLGIIIWTRSSKSLDGPCEISTVIFFMKTKFKFFHTNSTVVYVRNFYLLMAPSIERYFFKLKPN